MGEDGAVDNLNRLSLLTGIENQENIALRNCGIIDPINIDHYISREGFSGINRALNGESHDTIGEIEEADLKERGGEGAPVGEAYRRCLKASGEHKALVCNALENGPQKDINAALLENDPYAVLEGMLIASYACGADYGYICIDTQNTLAIERVKTVLEKMKEYGFIGGDTSNLKFNLCIEVIEMEGSIQYMDSKVLVACLNEGNDLVYNRPNNPQEAGVKGMPTIINYPETLLHLSAIMQKGAEWYKSIGFVNNRGTKVVHLSGEGIQQGLTEIELGTPLHQIIHQYLYDVSLDARIKGVQVGGSLGGFLPKDSLDLPFSYDLFAEQGLYEAFGSLKVLLNETCIVNQLKEETRLLQYASCGKCLFCREGNTQIFVMINEIAEGKGNRNSLDILHNTAENLKEQAICAFGRSSPNLVLTALHYFAEEINAHIKRKKCAALVCKSLVTYHILPEKCQGCQECMDACPYDAIEGDEDLIHIIDEDECEKCGSCREACSYEAVVKASGVKPKTPKKPIPVGSWKKKKR